MFKINLEDGMVFSQSNSGQNVDFIVGLSIFKVEKTLNRTGADVMWLATFKHITLFQHSLTALYGNKWYLNYI